MEDYKRWISELYIQVKQWQKAAELLEAKLIEMEGKHDHIQPE